MEKEEGITHGQSGERWELIKKGLWQEEVVFVEKKWRYKCICTAVNGGAMVTVQDSRVKQSHITYCRYSNKNKPNLLTKAFISEAMLKIFSNIRLCKNIYMK